MITIIIPAYNEAKIIKKNLFRVIKKLDKMKIKNYEIIVAEDGSTDGTYEIVKEIAKNNKKIKISHHDKKLGRGLALKKCSKLARGNFIIYMDADLSTRLEALRLMIRELKKYDIVVGSRYIKGAKYKRDFIRLLLSKTYNLIRLVLFPELKIKDAQCGFKGFRKDAFIEINKSVKAKGWFWDTEFLIRANKIGFKIKEIPVVWKENKKSSVKLVKDALELFMQLIMLKIETLHLF